MTYDAGDYDASLDAALKAGRLWRLRGAQGGQRSAASCAASATPATSRPAASRRRRRSARSAPASASGNRRGARQPGRHGRRCFTGSHSHGQGHETTFAQVVADRSASDRQVSIVHGDTDKVQFGMGTYGSRSRRVGMSAIVKALDKVEAKAKKIAAHLLEAATRATSSVRERRVQGRRHRQEGAVGQVALAAYTAAQLPAGKLEPGLKENAFYDPTNFTFPAGTYICEVEVDPDRQDRDRQLRRGDDFGNLINPMIVEGQVHGGIAQGIGQALLEGAACTTRRAASC
jgi:carbon-monoxide dehydrogenase large subunit